MELKVKLLGGSKLPRRAKKGDAGLDLTTTSSAEIAPFETVMLGTGIAVEIPEGHYGAVVPRSGMASKRGLAPANAPGTVDCGYRGEIFVPLHNMTSETQVVEAGERIAQLIIVPYRECECVEVGELSETERGSGGFGSTGSKEVC